MDAKEFIVKSVKMCETQKRTCNLCPANVDIWEGCPFDFFYYRYIKGEDLLIFASDVEKIVENWKEEQGKDF